MIKVKYIFHCFSPFRFIVRRLIHVPTSMFKRLVSGHYDSNLCFTINEIHIKIYLMYCSALLLKTLFMLQIVNAG